MTIKEVVRKYSKELKDVTYIPAKEVEILICYILNKNNIWLHLNYNKEFEQTSQLKKLLEKRKKDYPLEYLTNRASFYGESFIVKENVLIPRPETELLVDNALEILKDTKNKTILEIGTGSGVISIMLAILIEDIKIIAVDINDDALALAKQNAIKHKVEDKITFIKSDLYANIDKDEEIFMTISNPPYIANNYKLPNNVKYEPKNALFGGEDGDELLKKIIEETSKREIKYLLCEMGYDQKKPLENYLNNFDIKDYSFYQDYEKFDRGFTLQFK